MAEDILGISGHLDITDIERSLNQFAENLEKLGLNVDGLRDKMNRDFQAIANSTDDALTKNGNSLKVWGNAISEYSSMLSSASKTVEEQERKVKESSDKYEQQKNVISDLDRQLLEHKELLALNKKESEELAASLERIRKGGKGDYRSTNKDYKNSLKSIKEEEDAVKRLTLEKEKEKATLNELNNERQREKQNLTEIKKLYSDAQKEGAKLQSSLTKATKEHQNALSKIPKVHEEIADSMKTIAKLSLGYLSVEGARRFIDSCIEARKEMELLEIKFSGLFGNDKGMKLIGQMRDISLKSGIYTLSSLSETAETLSKYGAKENDIVPMLRELSDVAMGSEQRMNNLAMALGRLEMQGKLNSLSLRTLINSGFNPLDEISRTTGESIESLNAKMKKGSITAEMVKNALRSATSEGGKFYKMTDNLSDSIAGEQKRLSTIIKSVYVEWGKNHEEMIKGGYRIAQTLVKNYDVIGKTLAVLIATYGTYRTALIATAAIENVVAGSLVLKIRLLRMAVAAQRLLNAAMMANPYVLVATALVGLTTAIIAFSKGSNVAAAETERLKNREEEQAKATDELRDKIKKNTDAIKDETKSEGERQTALDELKKLLPNVFSKYQSWIDYQNDLANATRAANEELARQNELTLSGNVKRDAEMYDDLKDYYNAKNSLSFNRSDITAKKLKLIKKYPELFGIDKNSEDFKKRPEKFLYSNFSGQGTFETDIHYLNNYLVALSGSAINERNKLSEAQRTRWNEDLSKKGLEDTEEEIKRLEKLREKLKKQQTPLALQQRWQSQHTGFFDDKTPNSQQTQQMRNETAFIIDPETGYTYTEKELNTRLATARTRRSVILKNANTDYLQDSKKALDTLRKEEQEIIKNRNKKDKNGVKIYATEEMYQEALRKKREEITQAELRYKNSGGDPKIDNKEEDARKKRRELLKKQELEEKRQAIDLAFSTREAEVKAMEEGSEKVLAQIKLDHDRELESIQRSYEDMRLKRVEEAKKLWEAEPKNKKGNFYESDAYKQANINTEEETKNRDARLEAANAAYKKQIRDQHKEEAQAMREYLKQYGSFEQQRLAIVEDYEEKIREARKKGLKGEELRLQKELDAYKAKSSFEDIANSIDWKMLFSDLGAMSTQMMRETMKKLNAYVNTDAFRNSGAENQQKVVELISELKSYLGSNPEESVNKLAEAMIDFNESLDDYQKAQQREREAISNEKQAKAAYDDAKSRGESNEVVNGLLEEFTRAQEAAKNASASVVEARKNVDTFGSKLNIASDAVVNYTSKLSASLKQVEGIWSFVPGFSEYQNAVKNIDVFRGNINKSLSERKEKRVAKELAEGKSSVTVDDGASGKLSEEASRELTNKLLSAQDIGYEKILRGIGNIAEKAQTFIGSGLSDIAGGIFALPQLILNLASTIKNMVVGILNSIDEFLRLEWIEDFIVSILDAIANVVDAILDLPESIAHLIEGLVTGVGNAIGNIVDRLASTVGLGINWNDSNEAEHDELNEKLINANKSLEVSIEALKDSFDKYNGVKLIEASNEAIKKQEEYNKNLLERFRNDMTYHSAHKSNNYYYDIFPEQIEAVNNLLKKMGSSNRIDDTWESFMTLTPEEIKTIRTQLQDVWEGVRGEGYYDWAWEALEEYGEQADKIKEITEQLYENLTQTTEQNVFEGLLNDLYDVADGSEDVMTNIEERWQKMVNHMTVQNLVGDVFEEKLKTWYKNLAKLQEEAIIEKKNGTFSDREYLRKLNELKKQYDDYVQEGIEEIDAYKKAGIIKDTESYKQQAVTGSIQNISYDQADSLIGIETAQQIALEQIKSLLEKWDYGWRGDSIVQQGETIDMFSINEHLAMISAASADISTNVTSIRSSIEEMRYSQEHMNDYLAEISQYTRVLPMMSEEIVRIRKAIIDNQ